MSIVEYDSLFGKGTGLYVGDGASPENFTRIASVKGGPAGPDAKVKKVDATTHDTEGNYMDTQGVLIDPGGIKFTVNFNPAAPSHDPTTGLWSYFENLTTKNWQIRFPPSDADNNMLYFRGFIESHALKFPTADLVEADINIAVRGGVHWGTFDPLTN